MINVYVLFSDILNIGKISAIIEQNFSKINILKITDIKQIHLNDSKDKDILITDFNHHKYLDAAGLGEDSFNKFIVIDDVQSHNKENVLIIKKLNLEEEIYFSLHKYLSNFYKTKEYAPLPIDIFTEGFEYPCDLFLKLSNKRFIKILNANNSFDEGALQNLCLKEVTQLYCHGSEFKNMTMLKPKTLDNKNYNPTKQNERNELSGIEALHKHILDLGFDPKLIKMIKTMHKNIESKFNNKFMKKLFKRFQTLEGDFLYNHSYLTSVIALEVGKRFNWMNNENKEKIYLGSILHDLGHANKESALRANASLLEIDNMSKIEREDILNHPTKFSNHLAQIESIHPDIISMVKDHHGVHGEDSYPRAISPNEINLVFALFILSHEFSKQLYKINFDLDLIPQQIDILEQKFSMGSYKKILHEFRISMEETLVKEKAA